MTWSIATCPEFVADRRSRASKDAPMTTNRAKERQDVESPTLAGRRIVRGKCDNNKLFVLAVNEDTGHLFSSHVVCAVAKWIIPSGRRHHARWSFQLRIIVCFWNVRARSGAARVISATTVGAKRCVSYKKQAERKNPKRWTCVENFVSSHFASFRYDFDGFGEKKIKIAGRLTIRTANTYFIILKWKYHFSRSKVFVFVLVNISHKPCDNLKNV